MLAKQSSQPFYILCTPKNTTTHNKYFKSMTSESEFPRVQHEEKPSLARSDPASSRCTPQTPPPAEGLRGNAGSPHRRGARPPRCCTPGCLQKAEHLKSPGLIWAWVKIKPPGYGPQVLVFGSIYQGKPFWVPVFDPQPFALPPSDMEPDVWGSL